MAGERRRHRRMSDMLSTSSSYVRHAVDVIVVCQTCCQVVLKVYVDVIVVCQTCCQVVLKVYVDVIVVCQTCCQVVLKVYVDVIVVCQTCCQVVLKVYGRNLGMSMYKYLWYNEKTHILEKGTTIIKVNLNS